MNQINPTPSVRDWLGRTVSVGDRVRCFTPRTEGIVCDVGTRDQRATVSIETDAGIATTVHATECALLPCAPKRRKGKR